MERRRFLSYLLLGGAATLFTGVNFWSGPADTSESTRERLVRKFLRLETTDLSRSKALGQSYLQNHPWEADLRRLTISIADSCCRQGTVGLTGRDDYDVESQIQADFVHGRTVEVRGWILSCTEARLYALLSLS